MTNYKIVRLQGIAYEKAIEEIYRQARLVRLACLFTALP